MFVLLNKDMVDVHDIVRAYVEDDVTKVVVRCSDLTTPVYNSLTTPLFHQAGNGFKTIVLKSSVEELMKVVNEEFVRVRNL